MTRGRFMASGSFWTADTYYHSSTDREAQAQGQRGADGMNRAGEIETLHISVCFAFFFPALFLFPPHQHHLINTFPSTAPTCMHREYIVQTCKPYPTLTCPLLP